MKRMRAHPCPIILIHILLSVVPTAYCVICPTGCMGCDVEFMQCAGTEMASIPREIPSNVKIINIRNQNFLSRSLNQNLFKYYPDEVNQISIISTNLETVNTDTFIRFTNLKELDLSANKLTDISPYAFRGLNLKYLRLDKNIGLFLSDNAFEGLKVKSLILSGCGLKNIPYEIIRPILSSLTSLDLSTNRLTSLSDSFSPLFHPQRLVQLRNNPLTCDCKLLWLARALRIFQKENSKEEYEFPTCASPPTLKSRQIQLIRENDFYCTAPQLQQVDVNFQTSESGILTCSAEGPQDMRLSWNFEPQSTRKTTAHQTKAAVNFKRSYKSESDIYTCTASATTGTTQANIRVRWPRDSVRPPIKVPINPSNQNDQRLDYHQNSQRESTDQIGIRPPAADNIDSSNVEDDSVFFRKQFTLMEMIGAVIGTFTVTLAIFLVIYRCCIYNKEKRRKKAGYPTYETAYSDCQTYDLPQHPSCPLPPPPPNGPFLDFRTQRKMYNHV